MGWRRVWAMAAAAAAAAAEPGPVEAAIVAALQAAFEPAHLEVINESAAHNVAPGSETVRALTAAPAPRRPLIPLAARLLRSTSR